MRCCDCNVGTGPDRDDNGYPYRCDACDVRSAADHVANDVREYVELALQSGTSPADAQKHLHHIRSAVFGMATHVRERLRAQNRHEAER